MNPFSFEDRRREIIRIDAFKHQQGSTDAQFKSNYLAINSINLDLTEPLYRIFNYDYFLKDLQNNTLTLVQPHSWQDPFENFLLRSQGRLDDGTIVGFDSIRDSFYSQCWSQKEECDGLWRNYKGDNQFAIKVKTTSGKLFENLYDISNQFHYLSYFIGKVDYVSDSEIASYFKDKIDFNNFQSGAEFASTLLLKRMAFAYEEEVRIIVYEKNNASGNILPVQFDINNAVDEIVFDPWVNEDVFNEKKQELIDAGFSGRITRSGLYNEPFFIAKL